MNHNKHSLDPPSSPISSYSESIDSISCYSHPTDETESFESIAQLQHESYFQDPQDIHTQLSLSLESERALTLILSKELEAEHARVQQLEIELRKEKLYSADLSKSLEFEKKYSTDLEVCVKELQNEYQLLESKYEMMKQDHDCFKHNMHSEIKTRVNKIMESGKEAISQLQECCIELQHFNQESSYE